MSARVTIFGQVVDDETRCVHWHGPSDVVAMKFACCDRYYPCFDCHEADADHVAVQWPVSRFAEPAVLCGACGDEMSVTAYLATTDCPSCGALFNPGCSLHAHLYFAVPPATSPAVPAAPAPIGSPHA
jgi:uncharacterized CHY-type Zn-finger protein